MKNSKKSLKKNILFFILSILCLYFGYLIAPKKITSYGADPPACIIYPAEVYQAKLYTLIKDMREEKVKWKIFFWPHNKIDLPLCTGNPFP